MTRENSIHQILPTTLVGTGVLAKGNTITSLAVGQVGFFDATTNLSIDSTSNDETMREFYIAVGLDRDGDTVLDDIKVSAGQRISRANVTGYSLKCYSAARPQITEIVGFTANCDTQYGIKLEYEGATGIIKAHGASNLRESFIIKTDTCGDCATCGDGDANEVVSKLVAEVNLVDDGILLATAFGIQGTITLDETETVGGNLLLTLGSETQLTIAIGAGATTTVAGAAIVAAINAVTGSAYEAYQTSATVITVTQKVPVSGGSFTITGDDSALTDLDLTVVQGTSVAVASATTFGTQFPNSATGLRLTTVPIAKKVYTDFNISYEKLRSIKATVSAIAGLGFDTDATTITTTQTISYAEGDGYDLAYLEYEAGGWGGFSGANSYRVSELNGVPIGPFENLVDKTKKYYQIVLSYNIMSGSGFNQSYSNPATTVIAIECNASTQTAITAVLTTLDAIFATMFNPLVGDIATCASCTGTFLTSDASAGLDGLGA